MNFTVESVIKHMPPYSEAKPIETFKGTVEAESHEEAETRARSLVFARCRLLEQTYGDTYGFDSNNVRITLVPEAPIAVMAADEIVQLLKKHLDLSIENEEKAGQAYIATQDQNQMRRSLALAHYQNATTQKLLLQEIMTQVTGKDPYPAIVLSPRPPVRNRKITQPLDGGK